MKKLDLGQSITILANIGVIAGIIFLAIELRQNNELMMAQARADRRDIGREAVLRNFNYPELRRARRKALNGGTLTEDDIDVLELSNQAALTDWQYIYLEYRRGLLEEGAIPTAGWQGAFYGYNPGMPDYWSREEAGNFHPAFVEWMDETIATR